MTKHYDVVFIGAGIMTATLASMLRDLEPDWNMLVVERLKHSGLESSGAWHNAGTGHAALCELNYTPMCPDGNVEIDKAVKVQSQWQESLQYWASLAAEGRISHDFINAAPHMSFVTGQENVDFLRKRQAALVTHPAFASLEFTTDESKIAEWAPLLMLGRDDTDESFAATRSLAGTDVDFGRLTEELLQDAQRARGKGSLEVKYLTEAKPLKRINNGWKLSISKGNTGVDFIEANFVFVGAGGGTLPVLQDAGLKEVRGYGGFPITGKFWATEADEYVKSHRVKVYGQADEGAPPMSVPHLDARVIDGHASVLFGPFAGFSPRFLKNGSLLALFKAVRWHNLIPMLSVAFTNFSLVKYLVGELASSKKDKLATVRKFYPQAAGDAWREVVAGQRVQVIKPKSKFKGELQFGTELIVAQDGTMAGLLGASPGASTAVSIALDTLERAFPTAHSEWQAKLALRVPTLGVKDAQLRADAADKARAELGLP